MKRRKRESEIFSLSFLDCICCGFGAVLLLFVLTVGKKADAIDRVTAKTQEIIGEMDNAIALKDKELKEKQRSLTILQKKNRTATIVVDKKKKMQTDLEEELALLLAQLASIEEDVGKLLDEKENMPMQEEKPPIPIPNAIRRQYLTGFDIQGDNVLFLIEASGGMTDDDYEKAVARQADSDEDKRNSPKWSRVKKGMTWMIANLKPTSRYKIVLFNNELTPIETSYGVEWFDPSDTSVTLEVLEELDKVVPQQGANLEKALGLVDDMPVTPDRVVLIVDGLPTLADSYEGSSVLDDHDRINMFRVAKKALVYNAPVSVLLYPMKNDPGAAVHYWRLADEQGGSMVCPSKTWPNT